MKPISILFLILVYFSACNQPNEEDPTPELPTLSINGLEIAERKEDFNIALDVSLSASSEDLVVVSYETQSGLATEGEDFTRAFGQLIFEPGDLRKSISITILGDTKMEEDESFSVVLSDPANTTLKDSTAVVLIKNFDTSPPPNELEIPTTGYETPMSYEGWELVWNDEFEGQALNTADWTYETGGGGWGNNELQYYTNAGNTDFIDGKLIIEARKENFSGRAYTSTRMITKGKRTFQYGRVDIRAVLPFGQGIWPALWMLGDNISTVGWPSCGEIDIMEMVGGSGRENTTHGTIHWSNASNSHQYQGGGTTLPSGTFADEFHVFSIIWDETQIKWLMDDVQFHSENITSADKSEFHDEFFFIFNIAVGGNWPGNPNNTTSFSQFMIVDYIRVFQVQ